MPITPEDGQAAIVLDTETRDNVSDIPPGTTETVSNTASSLVNLDDDSSDPVTADDTVVIERNPPSVDVDKSYAIDQLTPGESTTATIRATNSSTPVTEMVITDPAEGTPNLVDQGLTFDGFTDEVEWPVAATEVSIQYTYESGLDEPPKTSTDNGTIPPPTEGERVTGFTITFTGPIQANAYANLPFDVTADPLPAPGDDSVTTTNTASSQVTASTGEESDVATDDADMTRNPVRIATDVTKNIGNDELPGVPGAGTTVTLQGLVCGECEDKAPSTTGSEYLQIVDPPSPSGTPSDFWNHFDVTSFGPIDVPANADLTVEYWDGDSWEPLAGPIEGPATWSYTPSAEEQEAIQGVRFTFTPKEGELLPPGFNVIINTNVELRDQLRDGSGPATPDPDGDPIVVENEAGSEAHNDNAIVPTDNATDGDDTTILPIPPGPGPDTIDKGWLDDAGDPQQTGVTVQSLTDDLRTARISWGTNLLPADQYVITDVNGDPQAVEDSVFDAWDLYRIEPIDDPLMTFDQIASVELYSDGVGWIDITDQACANGCDGTFGGYDLTEEQRETTLAVRITYEESPTRAERITSATDPQVGTGVARTAGNTRPLDLTFQLRQQLRSDPDQAVLGNTHDYTYNTGQEGLVRNNVDGTIVSGDETRTTSDSADILILDEPVNVEITKVFDQDELPVPPDGTPQADYPLITADLTATNTSVAKVRELRVDDPNASPDLQPEPFQTLNLYEIGDVTIPAGATDTAVELYRNWSATPTTYTLAEAQGFTPAELADVTGISVVHTGFIESQGTTAIELTFQLREANRVTEDPPVATSTPITNVAAATATNPHDSATGTADDTFTLVDPTYGVTAAKSITPPERYENESNEYVVTLTGQPTGTVRTVDLTLTDTTETFWNAFDFEAFQTVQLQAPIRQLKVDALVGVTYELDGDGAPVALCGGDEDLTDCWVEGEMTLSADDGTITPALPDGVAAADVRGLRITAENADGTQWERPTNPQLQIPFTALQRDTLRIGADGGDDTPVPSTLPGMETAPGETTQGETTDTVDVHAEGSWLAPDDDLVWQADDDATATTLLRHLPNAISVTKSPGNGSAIDPPLYAPGQSIPYTMTWENTGQWPITGLELTDQVDTDDQGSLLWEPRDVSGDPAPNYSFTLTGADGTEKSTDGFEASLDESTGLMTITVPDGFVFEPGDVLVLNAPLIFRPGLPPGTSVGNSVTATSDRTFDSCDYTTDQTIPGSSELVDECTATTHTGPQAASPIAVQKSVRGVGAGVEGAAEGDPNYDDLGRLVTGDNPTTACETPNGLNGFYRSPCVPITRPGGIERWQFSAQNVGNVPAHVIAGIDTFPRYGDVGVITGTPRGSEWETTIVGNPTNNLAEVDQLAKSVTWYYIEDTPSSTCNAADIRNETTPGGIPTTDPCYDEINNREWIEVTDSTTEEDFASADSVKFVIEYEDDGAGLAPESTINLTLDTRTAWAVDNGVTSAPPIAWNSVASGTQGVTGDQVIVSPIVEPTRVGVATATGKLDLQKVVEGADLPGVAYPDAYTFRVSCTSGPDTVTLLDSEGNDASLVTLQADGTLVTYNGDETINLPLYADCTLTEEPLAQGATVTYEPASDDGTSSGAVEALNDQVGREDIADPAFPDEIELAGIVATNTYAAGGFTVSKDVDEGGAVNQDGDPIVYDETYDFTASCTFLGGEVVPEADQSFTLADGEEKVFSDLPAGSDCTVEETGTGGSASTSVVVTENGEEGDPTDGTSAEFTIGADDGETHVNAAAFTNHYTVGAMSLTKSVTGSGAEDWGDGPFEIQLVCTLDGADPTTVYDDTHTLTPPDDLTWEVTNLPTGADCTVTETDDAGATSVDIENDTFTVGDDVDDPTLVTVTNTFEVGGVELTKELFGLENDLENVRETGEFTFALACTYDGEPVDIPDGATRTISYAADDPEVVNWDGIPVGSECEVEESAAVPDPLGTIIQPSSFTISEDGADPIEVRAINIYTPGWLELNKVVEGDAANFAPDEFTIQLECTREGAPETLPNDGVVTLPGNGDVVIYGPVPEGSECQIVSEEDAGATEVDLGETVVIPELALDPPQIPSAEITVTNTYDATGFTVEKAVEGATDQDGNPISYTTSFDFTATCEFLGDEILDESEQSFSLTQGQTQEFSGLPVGAECAVTETGTAGAAETSVVVTQDGETVEPDGQTDTESGTFTLVEGDSAVTLASYTNTMPVGQVTVTKAIDGDGAELWGDGEFEVQLVCTDDEADPTTVYDATHTLSGDDPTWTVDTLPVGADCVVTETRTGGATSSAVEPADGVTVTGDDADEPAEITVTNTFDIGAIEVEKAITGPGADERGGGKFTVEVVCTRDVDGTAEEIEIPGGAERTLQRPDQLLATYDELPVGADCVITETEAGGAEKSTVDPGTVTVGSADEPVQVTVTNRFDASPPPPGGDDNDGDDNDLPWTGSTVGPLIALLALALIAAGLTLIRRRREA